MNRTDGLLSDILTELKRIAETLEKKPAEKAAQVSETLGPDQIVKVEIAKPEIEKPKRPGLFGKRG